MKSFSATDIHFAINDNYLCNASLPCLSGNTGPVIVHVPPLPVSVEDILCYGVKRRYASSKQLSSSAKILSDLGKTFPVAAATYEKCYGSKVEPCSTVHFSGIIVAYLDNCEFFAPHVVEVC